MAAAKIDLEANQQMHNDSTRLSSLLPALHRLDGLLESAVRQMQVSNGPSRATSLQGLFVSRDQVDRLLSQTPGQLQFQLADAPRQSDNAAFDDPALGWLINSFGLNGFDADVILLSLAPEIDLRYERIYSYLQDDVTRKRPSVDLALNLLCTTAEDKLTCRARFSTGAPLVNHRLVQIVHDANQLEPSSLAYFLRLDDQIRHLLLGLSGLDERLSAFSRIVQPSAKWDDVSLHTDVKQGLSRLAQESVASRKPLRLYFQGAADAEKLDAAEGLANLLCTNLLSVRVDRLPDNLNSDLIWNLITREAQLQHAVLFISDLDGFHGADATTRRRDLLQGVAAFSGITILAGRTSKEPRSIAPFGIISVDFQALDFQERFDRWQQEIAKTGSTVTAKDIEALAGRYRLTPLKISRAVNAAHLSSEWRQAQTTLPTDRKDAAPPLTLEELSVAARSQCGTELSNLAPKIELHYGWDDLILPPDAASQLREICSQAENRAVVYGRWGFDRKLSLGKGLNVLFTGPPGTGKTMAAEVLAHELGLDLYRIDLSQVVSKYIGETEKNLDRIFTAAEDSNAILFFDEADSLFGRRSEVVNSNDRYANIEISYLLQKMEEYLGISILATNLRGNIDDAFVRRLQAIVEFPFPDDEYRRRIWQSVFPKEAPVGDDVRFDLLAKEVRLAGGNIKNMALAAAFYAAADGSQVHLSHLLHAAYREHQKLARSWNPGELLKAAAAAQSATEEANTMNAELVTVN